MVLLREAAATGGLSRVASDTGYPFPESAKCAHQHK